MTETEVLSFCDRKRAWHPSIKIIVLAFLVFEKKRKKNYVKPRPCPWIYRSLFLVWELTKVTNDERQRKHSGKYSFTSCSSSENFVLASESKLVMFLLSFISSLMSSSKRKQKVLVLVLWVINKGNLMTEWRTVLSVIIGEVKQHRGNPICSIANMTVDKNKLDDTKYRYPISHN